MNIKYTTKLFSALFAFSFLLMGCEKEDEMVVDRVVSPVLVVTNSSTSISTQSVNVTATIYELDKSGILNNAIGIDSIPVSNLAIKVMLNNNAIADLTTDASGKVSLNKSWSELSLATPKAGSDVILGWSGNHKNQAFTDVMKLQVK